MGSSLSWPAFRWALTEQESGGRYDALGPPVGGDRAYGRYQVMGANIPSWTRQYYGRSLTPQEYLADHAAQDAVVDGKLGGYFRQWGPRGAAAAWYAGPANHGLDQSTRPQPGGPSIKDYVDQVLARAAGYRGQDGGGAGDVSWWWPDWGKPGSSGGGDLGLVDALKAGASSLGTIATAATSSGRLADQLMKLALPTTLTRVAAGAAGIVLIFVGIHQITRQLQEE